MGQKLMVGVQDFHPRADPLDYVEIDLLAELLDSLDIDLLFNKRLS